jgi:catechol 2,3-dioxygenase-like lactoylglutathione lyase family enzyme
VAGAPPSGGFAPLVPELIVTDLEISLAFWRDLLGFRVAYDRPEQRFVYLERGGAQAMLRQRDGVWETGPLTPPLGRGIMFQIEVADLPSLESALAAAGWPLHAGPREVWRQAGDRRVGQREIFVLDPDGYLLMLASEKAVAS